MGFQKSHCAQRPLLHLLATVPHKDQNAQTSRRARDDYQPTYRQSPGKGGTQIYRRNLRHGKPEYRKGHQSVINPLHNPRCKLGCKRDIAIFCNQIGAYHLTGATEDGDRGKADYGGREQRSEASTRLHRMEEHSPPKRPDQIGGPGPAEGLGNPPPVELAESCTKCRPIKATASVAGLKNPQQDGHQDHCKAQNPAPGFDLLRHSGKK